MAWRRWRHLQGDLASAVLPTRKGLVHKDLGPIAEYLKDHEEIRARPYGRRVTVPSERAR